MNPFAGKTATERNKIIAAGVLGVMALAALWMAFGGNLFGGKKTITVTASPTPKPSAAPNGRRDELQMPSVDELSQIYATIPVNYEPGNFYAPDAGRNIFAFYEPPPPTPYSPTPTPVFIPKTPEPPPPTPTPPQVIGFLQPQSVYAGSKGFRLEVNGDGFTPETRIYFNGNEMPTTFVSPQKLVTDVPANFIAGEGQIQIMVRTPDGKLYAFPVMFNVQAPPRPQMQYVGMIGRKGYNNDTAVFREQGKTSEFSARLNDVIGGRFRIFSISASETIVEDVNLGFRHKLPLLRPAPGQATAGTTGSGGNNQFPPPGSTYNPYQNGQPQQQQDIPGIPNNIPRYIPPNPPPDQKDDVDDEDGDGNR
jgi:hypothetical protein